ncbi:hypothetical protein [Sulfurospirillum diekertiae]|uniref:Lipoprotein n=1 Tax=Sulfurospirillum diekertiae TaxID=1854492 RepID=A0A1Y0HJ45_9BACT|nr:hypothetical protein [Sulfurospirillum diekertiae]ARU48127.1 hypothetical protein Sdiek1_0961 [Sulfurospirillum diekertiae]ASC92970.1 hypothetical protein Sdiek2_0949 [Sulfurospirillum diekertiae]
MPILKKISMVLLSINCLFVFSGCASKPQMSIDYGKDRIVRNDTIGRVIIVQGKETWRSPSDGYNKATRNIHLLQNSANATLDSGYNYFSFTYPQELSPDGSFSMVNTAEEYIQNCAPNGAFILTIGHRNCGLTTDNQIVTAVIFAYKEAPKTFLVYDAKEVKEYLVKNNHYREDGYQKVEALPDYYIQQIPQLYSLLRW